MGISLAISFKSIPAQGEQRGKRQMDAFRKATVRFLKMFLLGVLTQGGINFMQYDLQQIRVMGILQRVAVCYYVVALMEIFLPRFPAASPKSYSLLEDSAATASSSAGRPSLWQLAAIFRKYPLHWLCGILLVAAHTAVLYGVDVPPAFGLPCGRGVLTPPCNAATYIDSMILTPDHMYYPANGGGDAPVSLFPQSV